MEHKYSSKSFFIFSLIVTFLTLILLTGCVNGNDLTKTSKSLTPGRTVSPVTPQATLTNSPTPTIVISPTESPGPDSVEKPAVWISPVIPDEFMNKISPSLSVDVVESINRSDFFLQVIADPSPEIEPSCPSAWVYAAVAPFPTIIDGIGINDLKQAWFGEKENLFANAPLLMTRETYDIFTSAWGVPIGDGVQIVEQTELIDYAWQERPSWAIVPFENLEPRWKVISVDGMSPLDSDLDIENYPLTLHFCLKQTPGEDKAGWDEYLNDFIGTNRYPEKMTSIVLTGTTALVRNLAFKMETNGINYPAEKIKNWLQGADILHISNEVSFFDDCPPAVPVYLESRFCSSPSYFELFNFIGVDVIELTGNHLFDWGKEPFIKTLDLYKDKNIPVYGGGKNLESARQPVFIEHNGNRFAFIGCSPAGPENVWATDDEPGTAPCDFDWIEEEIDRLEKLGYITIFTFQHFESDDYVPHSSQRVDFTNVSEAGSAIVSGSQSHFPQSMAFVEGKFIHYGLGNLFFDQMEKLKRNQFIDRHIFYDGRHISTVLLTSILEDYSQPRPMLPVEREKFLKTVFSASRW